MSDREESDGGGCGVLSLLRRSRRIAPASPTSGALRAGAAANPLTSVLPDDLLVRIFQVLPLPSLGSCARVCRRWHTLSASPRVWRTLYLQHFGSPLAPVQRWPEAFRWRLDQERRLGIYEPIIKRTVLCELPFWAEVLMRGEPGYKADVMLKLRALSALEPPPLDDMAHSGVLPQVVRLVAERNGETMPVADMVYVLCRASQGGESHCAAMRSAGAVRVLVDVIRQENSNPDLRAEAVLTVGNIAAQRDDWRDEILQQGALREGVKAAEAERDPERLEQFSLGLTRMLLGTVRSIARARGGRGVGTNMRAVAGADALGPGCAAMVVGRSVSVSFLSSSCKAEPALGARGQDCTAAVPRVFAAVHGAQPGGHLRDTGLPGQRAQGEHSGDRGLGLLPALGAADPRRQR